MKKGLFSKVTVVYCVLFCSIMSIWAMWIADKDGILVTGVIAAIFGVFGGELLLLCLKRILGSPADTAAKINNDIDCE